MSVSSPFFLRSNNGTGEVFFAVEGHTVTEICLFSPKISFEQYPMEVKWLTIKSGIWAVKEISAEQFEQAKLTFFQKAGVKIQIVPEPLADSPPVSPSNAHSPLVTSSAMNGSFKAEDFPY